MTTHQTIIIGRKKVAEKTLEISFRRPENFSFRAGQYLQLAVQRLLFPDIKGVSRVFSISSSPLDQKRIAVTFRNTGSGFKRTLEELPIGTEVTIEGPHGFFTLPSKAIDPLVFIAGGIGITPYLSMIRFATERKLTLPITLLYVNTDKERASYLEELQTIVNCNKYLTLKNRFGRIDEEFIWQTVKNMQNCKWYIAGPQAMVDYVRNTLFLLGVSDEYVYCEAFTGYE